jgi:hypothetical protein
MPSGTTASRLKDLRVPPRDAQIILGHANFATTQRSTGHFKIITETFVLVELTRLELVTPCLQSRCSSS